MARCLSPVLHDSILVGEMATQLARQDAEPMKIRCLGLNAEMVSLFLKTSLKDRVPQKLPVISTTRAGKIDRNLR
jgi:hypothetical protein